MALVKGICKNFGECDLADNKEIQEVDKTNFVCEECGKPLHPVDGDGGGGGKTPGGGPNMKLIGIIAAALVILAGVVFCVYSLFGGTKIEKIIVDKNVLSLNVGQSDIIKASAVDKEGEVIMDANIIYNWIAEDKQVASVTQEGKATALKEGKTLITVKVADDEKLFAICQVEVKDTISAKEDPTESSDKDHKEEIDKKKGEDEGKPRPIRPEPGPKVSWGKYEGPANGLGGTITVTRSYSLDLHDNGEPLELSPGDEIQQTKFTNGELRGGVWVHNGSRRSFTR